MRDLKPVYGIIPDIPLTEVKVTSLEGYRGMGPVRIGNLAQEQVQNDSYGSIILAAAQMFFDRRLPVRGDLDLLTRLEQLGLKAVAVAFRARCGHLGISRPPGGPYPFGDALLGGLRPPGQDRRQPRPAGARAALARRSRSHPRDHPRARLESRRSAASSTVFGGETADASLLLLQEVGLVSAADPRFVSTLAHITGALRHGDDLYRYYVRRRFRPADDRLHHLHLLVHRRARRHRPARGGPPAVRGHAGAAQSPGPALGGHRPQDGRALGQLPADLFAGRPDRLRHAASKSWEEAFWRGW